MRRISTHTPREGRDTGFRSSCYPLCDFNSHAPRGARLFFAKSLSFGTSISTHTPREGRDNIGVTTSQQMLISTHTPREGRDGGLEYCVICPRKFQLTRPARGATIWLLLNSQNPKFQLTRPARGATINNRYEGTVSLEFQLTRPARGATKKIITVSINADNFNSHAPRGARPCELTNRICYTMISTHTPREGRDLVVVIVALLGLFISTHTPREGRDIVTSHFRRPILISTHTPREGRDAEWSTTDMVTVTFQLTRPARGATYNTVNPKHHVQNFNSHAPRGARHFVNKSTATLIAFQLTRPARGATPTTCTRLLNSSISTHTPREGRDLRKNGITDTL